MPRTPTRSFLALAALFLWAGSSVAAERQAWDQKDAATTASNLASAVDGIYKQARIESYGAQDNLSQAADVYVFVEDIKMLRRVTRSLAGRLEKGQKRDETRALFGRVQRLVRSIRAKRSVPLLENSQAEIDQARGFLEALTRYYEASTPPVASPSESSEESE